MELRRLCDIPVMKAQVGSGHEGEFGKIVGATEITTDNSDGIRNGITKRVTSTSCGVPWYQKKMNHLAGGARGTWGNPQEDCLPGEKGT